MFPSLSDGDIRGAAEKIAARFEGRVEIVDWQPTVAGEITYAQPQACADSCAKAPPEEWTFYIDVDEFIVVRSGVNIGDMLQTLEENGVLSLQFFQKKFRCRFVGLSEHGSGDRYLVSREYRMLEINTRNWAPKCAIKNRAFDRTSAKFSIHDLPVSYGTSVEAPESVICFHHYNMNDAQLMWLKEHLPEIDVTKSVDELSRYSTNRALEWFESVSENHSFLELPTR